MEKVSAVGLAGFAARCRRRDAPWKEAESSEDVGSPRHPHPPAFLVAAGYFQGQFQALAAVGQCHEHTGTALSSAVSSCLSSPGGTPGLFLLRVLIALANYTDVGGVDSRLNVSHRARTAGKKAGWAL